MSERQIWRKEAFGEVSEIEIRPRPVEIIYDAYSEGVYLGPMTEAQLRRNHFEKVENGGGSYVPRISRERIYAPHSAAPLREAVSRHWERGAVKVVLEKERGKEEWTLEATRFEREDA